MSLAGEEQRKEALWLESDERSAGRQTEGNRDWEYSGKEEGRKTNVVLGDDEIMETEKYKQYGGKIKVLGSRKERKFCEGRKRHRYIKTLTRVAAGE